jgi:hypothetical protein
MRLLTLYYVPRSRGTEAVRPKYGEPMAIAAKGSRP